MRGGRAWGRGPVRCYNCDHEGHVCRERSLLRRPWFSKCRVNAHATEDCPKLIAKWEARTRKRGTNFINVEPRTTESFPIIDINIVTRGGKKIGDDQGMEDPPSVVWVESSKKS